MMQAIRSHWQEYLIEAAGLGIFMISAGVVVTLLESSALPVQSFIPDPFLRRILIGIAMGLTAIALIYSPWGKRSGAHFNPAVTLTFFRLGKLSLQDTFGYILAQFLGGLTGVILVTVVFSTFFTAPPVNYIVTVPKQGWFLALIVELLMAFGLMLMVLFVSNHQHLAKFTGLFAGILVATYIILAAPISGMSINPARSFASAFPADIWTAFWVYYFAPPLGMLLAAEIYLKYPKRPRVLCGKLCPNSETPCICNHCCCEEMRIKLVE
jgi:aquaporin Z